MRRSTLLLAVLLAASFSTVADAAKKKADAPKPDPAIQAQANTAAFMNAAFTSWAPAPVAPAKPAKAKKAKKG